LSRDLTPTSTIDIGNLIDEGRFSGFQKAVVAVVASAVIIDGFDGQLIGYAIPVIAKEWGIARTAFAPAVAAGLLGMGVGSACAGILGDRFGRRRALIGSVLLFAVATCAVGFSPNLLAIAVLRFIAGVGIGGALPSATTLAAEFTPKRIRTVAVTATIVCVPLGGMVAGMFAGCVLPRSGWRPLFWFGGALPLLLAMLLFAFLPESPRYLARHRERWNELTVLLQRFTAVPPSHAEYKDEVEQRSETHRGFAALLRADYRRDTVALWSAFFMCMLAIYSAFSWLPSVISSAGLSASTSAAGLTAYNGGGVLGALLCAFAIARLGSRVPMLACCIGGAVSAFMLIAVHPQTQTTLFLAGIGIHGLFVNAVQSTMWALAAQVYPTAVRATGSATAAMFGRLGAVLSSFAAAAAISRFGSTGYLTLLAVAMIFVLVALSAIRRHVAATSQF
jgi:AAHS family 4-hydroxybenzoate transporter-like MFS transporter